MLHCPKAGFKHVLVKTGLVTKGCFVTDYCGASGQSNVTTVLPELTSMFIRVDFSRDSSRMVALWAKLSEEHIRHYGMTSFLRQRISSSKNRQLTPSMEWNCSEEKYALWEKIHLLPRVHHLHVMGPTNTTLTLHSSDTVGKAAASVAACMIPGASRRRSAR